MVSAVLTSVFTFFYGRPVIFNLLLLIKSYLSKIRILIFLLTEFEIFFKSLLNFFSQPKLHGMKTIYKVEVRHVI